MIGKILALIVVALVVVFGVLYLTNERSPKSDLGSLAEGDFNVLDIDNMGNLSLSSAVFNGDDKIPAKYTCEGDDANPPLEISGVPEGAKSLVLIVDDPDAVGGVTWDHWVVWNISPDTSHVAEGTLPTGAVQGVSSFGHQRYGGPCPPVGDEPHRYFFKLYALDDVLSLPSDSTKKDVEKAMEDHILDKVELMGMYQRK